MGAFNIKNREFSLREIKSTSFDVIIVGGGVTGAGIFLDAQLRGLNCCLLEMQDFSEGTSSRSTKLIHGGLRYLKQFNFKLVRETGKERNVIATIARHLTHPKKVLLPVIKGGGFSMTKLRLALRIYESLSQVPKELKHKRFSKQEMLDNLPSLNPNGLLGGMEYVEYQTNDSRLTIELIKTGVANGGIALNRLKVHELILDKKGQAIGVKCIDLLTGNELIIQGGCIINATGAWSEDLFNLPDKNCPTTIPTKGIHLVFDAKRIPLSKAVYFDTSDNRMIFAIPEDGNVYVGTTDTFYKGDLTNPNITPEDVNYLIDACNSMFSDIHLRPRDIKSAFSGIRSLIYQKNKKPSEISRKYELFVSTSGVLTVTGGKLTGYRKMAEKSVDEAIRVHFNKRDIGGCITKEYYLSGSEYDSTKEYDKSAATFIIQAKYSDWTCEEASWVFSLFGKQAFQILLSKVDPHPSLPDYLIKTLMYTLSNEMVVTPLDFFSRRTNLFHFHNDKVVEHFEAVAEIIGRHNNLSHEWQLHEEDRFKEMIGTLKELRNL